MTPDQLVNEMSKLARWARYLEEIIEREERDEASEMLQSINKRIIAIALECVLKSPSPAKSGMNSCGHITFSDN